MPVTAAPTRRQCGTMEVHQRLLERFAGYRIQQIDIETFTARFMLFDAGRRRTGNLEIPVVVHVVYKNPAEKVSDAQVRSQVAVLNRDYRAKNPDRRKTPTVWRNLVGDARIQFALAKKDGAGKATSGITWTQTSRPSFTTNDEVKAAATGGADPWPSDKFLNLWVCTLEGQLLGYAQFPGGPAKTDGVVIRNTAFGTKGSAAAPFNLGRTATHEIGHWLNLRHIWGDTHDCSGSDYVDDTPFAQDPNYGKPSARHITCNNGPDGDMFMNYMDYVDDAAMFMFTHGQVDRMNAALSGPRDGLGVAVKESAGRKKRGRGSRRKAKAKR